MPFRSLDRSLAAAAPALTAGAPRTVGLTLAMLRDELFLAIGSRADVPPSRLNLWVNLAYADVTSSVELDELQSSFTLSTVIDQHLYLLPSAVGITKGAALYNPTRYSILGGRLLDKSDLNEYRMSEEATGEPRSYFRSADLLVLYPAPDAVYEIAIDFLIRPDLLVDDEDAPILPYELQEGILLAARYKAFTQLLEFDKSAPALNDYIAFMRRKLDKTAAEDSGKIVGSLVPRRGRELIWRRPRTAEEWQDGLR